MVIFVSIYVQDACNSNQYKLKLIILYVVHANKRIYAHL